MRWLTKYIIKKNHIIFLIIYTERYCHLLLFIPYRLEIEPKWYFIRFEYRNMSKKTIIICSNCGKKLFLFFFLTSRLFFFFGLIRIPPGAVVSIIPHGLCYPRRSTIVKGFFFINNY